MVIFDLKELLNFDSEHFPSINLFWQSYLKGGGGLAFDIRCKIDIVFLDGKILAF